MMSSNTSLRISVLMIGSLIWDEKCYRQKWRQVRLRICNRDHVTVPIRYGRKSSSRGNTYTMVFSSQKRSSQEEMGVGVAVPCVHKVQCSSDLIDEAEALWTAEQSGGKDTSNRISASWGCVGIVCNSKLAQEQNIIKIKEEWSHRVKAEIKECSSSLYARYKVEGEKKPIIDGDGILDIPWPQTEAGEAYDGADILLATVTKPNVPPPSPEEIAEAWNNKGHTCYFRQNQVWGIRTSEDDEIKKHLT